jgi:hypothetical protein
VDEVEDLGRSDRREQALAAGWAAGGDGVRDADDRVRGVRGDERGATVTVARHGGRGGCAEGDGVGGADDPVREPSARALIIDRRFERVQRTVRARAVRLPSEAGEDDGGAGRKRRTRSGERRRLNLRRAEIERRRQGKNGDVVRSGAARRLVARLDAKRRDAPVLLGVARRRGDVVGDAGFHREGARDGERARGIEDAVSGRQHVERIDDRAGAQLGTALRRLAQVHRPRSRGDLRRGAADDARPGGCRGRCGGSEQREREETAAHRSSASVLWARQLVALALSAALRARFAAW